MQYLVHTSGNVVRNEKQTYVVTGKNKEEAIEKATDMFAAEHDVIDATVKTSTPKLRAIWSLLSSGLMLFAAFLSILIWTKGHEQYSIRPDLVSGIYALLFYAVYLIRFKGLGTIINSKWTDIISAPLTVFIIAALFKTLISRDVTIPIINKTIPGDVAMLFAIFLSAVGFKLISVLVMLATAIMTLFEITKLSAAMNINGFIFVFCAVFGLLIKAGIEPAFYNMIPAVYSSTRMLGRSFKSDLLEARKEINAIRENVRNRINSHNVASIENNIKDGGDINE